MGWLWRCGQAAVGVSPVTWFQVVNRVVISWDIDIGGDDVSVTAPIGQPVRDRTRSCAQIQAPPRRIHRQSLEDLYGLGIRVQLQ